MCQPKGKKIASYGYADNRQCSDRLRLLTPVENSVIRWRMFRSGVSAAYIGPIPEAPPTFTPTRQITAYHTKHYQEPYPSLSRPISCMAAAILDSRLLNRSGLNIRCISQFSRTLPSGNTFVNYGRKQTTVTEKDVDAVGAIFAPLGPFVCRFQDEQR